MHLLACIRTGTAVSSWVTRVSESRPHNLPDFRTHRALDHISRRLEQLVFHTRLTDLFPERISTTCSHREKLDMRLDVRVLVVTIARLVDASDIRTGSTLFLD